MLMLLHRKITEHIREKDEKKETRVIHRRREFSGCDKKLVFAKAVSISASLTFKISKRHLRFVPKLLDLP